MDDCVSASRGHCAEERCKVIIKKRYLGADPNVIFIRILLANKIS